MSKTVLVTLCACLWICHDSGISRAELPSAARYFACVLDGDIEAFQTPPQWISKTVADGSVSIRMPAEWKPADDTNHERFEAPKGQISITLRRGGAIDLDALKRLRRAIELTELGPSHINRRCSQRLAQTIHTTSGWKSSQLGIYGRPMGERERIYALFGILPKGSLTVLIKARWKPDTKGPDLSLIRRLLAGIQPIR